MNGIWWINYNGRKSEDELAEEWILQGGKPFDNIADVLTNILQRLKALEESEKQ